MPSAPAPFGTLFDQTINVAKAIWKPAVLGALFFLALFILTVVMTVIAFVVLGLSSVFETHVLGANAGEGMIVVLLVIILLMLISWASGTYYQVLAIERHKSMWATLRRVPAVMVPLAYASIWMFVRTYMWVPLILLLCLEILVSGNQSATAGALGGGLIAMIVCVVYFTPRVIFTPMLTLRGMKPLEAARLSEQHAKGYWGKIVGNMLLLALIVGILSFGIQMLVPAVTASLSGLGPKGGILSFMISMIVGMIFMVFSTVLNMLPLVFVVQLHDTLAANPR